MSETSQAVLNLYSELMKQIYDLFQAMTTTWLTSVVLVLVMVGIILRIFLALRGKNR